MTWIRLDDGFISHPKIQNLTHKAIVLHVAGLTYCAAHLTDGKIPKQALPMVLATARVSRTSIRPLVDADMWADQGECYVIHDYLEYQESAETVKERRARWATQKAKQRATPQQMSAVDSAQDSAVESARPNPTQPNPIGTSTLTTHPLTPVDIGGGIPTKEAIAKAAGKRHAQSETHAGRATNAEGLAVWKTKNALEDQPSELAALVTESAAHHKRTGEHIPVSVLADALLGNLNGIAGYRAAPEPIADIGPPLSRDQRLKLITDNRKADTA